MSALGIQQLFDNFDSDDEDLPTWSNPLSSVSPSILEHLSHLDLSGRIIFIDGLKVRANGSYGDVSQGRLKYSDGKGIKVAIKRLRICYQKDIINLFEKEVYVWSKLKHPNVLSLLGFAFDDCGYPLLVSQWMKNGSAESLIGANKPYDLERLVLGIAEGLAYLHENGVVHSDIKPGNIVVSKAGDALICDFGCARMTEASRSLGRMSDGIKGTTLYMAYELLACESSEHTPYSKEADVWAFGMSVYELCMRRQPYWHIRAGELTAVIKSRGLPRLPELIASDASQFKELLWSICRRCWLHDPEDRIQMTSVVSELRNYKVQTGHLDELQLEETMQGPPHELDSLSAACNLSVTAGRQQSLCIMREENNPRRHLWEQAESSLSDFSRSEPCQASEGNMFAISSIAYSIDCEYIVSGCEDGMIRFWDVTTGQVSDKWSVARHGNGVLSIAFAPDGERLVSGCSDGTVRLIYVTSKDVEVWEGHDDRVVSIAFSPDGSRIASGSADMTIRLWDSHTGTVIGGPLKGHTESVTSVIFSSDARCVSSGSYDKTIRFWDAKSGEAFRDPLEYRSGILCLAYSPDGRYIASGFEDSTIVLKDLITGAEGIPLIGHDGRVLSIAFSPDGRYLVSASEDETIQLWNIFDMSPMGDPLDSNMGAVLSVAFSGDGTHVAAASVNGINLLTIEGRGEDDDTIQSL